MIRRKAKLHLTASAIASAISAAIALAPAPAQAELKSFDIPAQPLSTAIAEFSRQSGQVVTAPAALVRGKTAAAVQGMMEPEEALARLLASGGLRYAKAPNGALLIEAAPAGEPGAGQGPAGSAAADNGDAVSDNQVDQEIIVTGTHIRGSAPSGSHVIVIDREGLERTGRGTLAEAIQVTPQVHASGPNERNYLSGQGSAFTSGSVGSSSINLRGLGVEETLVLLNGRRMAPAGSNGAFVDVSAIPLSAVKRVEILADGASATYGADAMAGVVNIILDDHFEGAETTLRYGIETQSGNPELRASQLLGTSSDRFSLMAVIEYHKREGISTDQRDRTAAMDRRPSGGHDYRIDYSNPGNIIAPAPLAGAIPRGQDGTALTPGQILRGQENLSDYGDGMFLISPSEQVSAFISASTEVSGGLELSADLMISRRKIMEKRPDLAELSVPTANAFRVLNGFSGSDYPLNQPLTIHYLFPAASKEASANKVKAVLANVGAEYAFGNAWTGKASVSYGESASDAESLFLDIRPAMEGGVLNTLLASGDPETAFNPFSDGSPVTPELYKSLFFERRLSHGSVFKSVGLGFDGILLELPAGALKLAVGGDLRSEKLTLSRLALYPDQDPISEVGRKAGRDVSSLYSEVFIPAFSERNSTPLLRNLTFSVSARYDRYSDFGTTINPRGGFTWGPVAGLEIRGTIGTAFRAPLLGVLNQPRQISYESHRRASPMALDPNSDGFISLLKISGGNPDLGPEKAKSWTLGGVVSPVSVPGFRTNLTYFEIQFRGRFGNINIPSQAWNDLAAYEGVNYITLPSASQVNAAIEVSDEVIGTIPPPSEIEAVLDTRMTNLLASKMRGLDFGAAYSLPTFGGVMSLEANVSWLLENSSRIGSSETRVKMLDDVGQPASLRGRASLAWSGSGLDLLLGLNYIDDYRQRIGDSDRKVNSYTTVDLAISTEINAPTGFGSEPLELSLNAVNILDQRPPFVDTEFGYDGANADPIGRRLSLTISKRW